MGICISCCKYWVVLFVVLLLRVLIEVGLRSVECGFGNRLGFCLNLGFVRFGSVILDFLILDSIFRKWLYFFFFVGYLFRLRVLNRVVMIVNI